MNLTADSFRALAQSSPWRWRTLHFVRHRTASDAWVEAKVERPGVLRVTDAAGRTTVLREETGAGSVVLVSSGQDDAEPGDRRFGDVIRDAFATGVAEPGNAGAGNAERDDAERDDAERDDAERDQAVPQVVHVPARDVQPVRRPDGLVAERPDAFREGDRHVWVDYDDPMLDNYRWVAMLDPAELAAGTTVSDLAAGEHRGRPAWFATMKALPGYEPRCGCCSLLWSAVSDIVEYGADHRPYRPYPDSYRVGLDVQTGVVVWLIEDDHRVEIDLEILAVDDDPATDRAHPVTD